MSTTLPIVSVMRSQRCTDMLCDPELTDSEEILVRSFVTARQAGEDVSPYDMLDDIDRDCCCSGQVVYQHNIDRLSRILQSTEDLNLKLGVRAKLHVLEEVWLGQVDARLPFCGAIKRFRDIQVGMFGDLPAIGEETSPLKEGSETPNETKRTTAETHQHAPILVEDSPAPAQVCS